MVFLWCKVKYKRILLKVLFVFNRHSIKVGHSVFTEFIHTETAKSPKVIDTTDNVQMFVTLSCDVSYSTRESAKGQVKDKSNVHHYHQCTCIVLRDGRRIRFKFGIRDVSGVDTLPLPSLKLKSSDRVPLQSAILLKMVVLCQRDVSATAVPNGGGTAVPSMAGARTKMEFPLVVKWTIPL